jgi:hypothetical protein
MDKEIKQSSKSKTQIPRTDFKVIQWEYKIVYDDKNESVDFGELGLHGWELVSVIDQHLAFWQNRRWYYFKRPKKAWDGDGFQEYVLNKGEHED